MGACAANPGAAAFPIAKCVLAELSPAGNLAKTWIFDPDSFTARLATKDKMVGRPSRGGGKAMCTINTILHPTDFSAEAKYAFRVACSLAKDYNARLVLLHVMRPSVAPVLQDPVPDPLEPAESQREILGTFPWPEPSDPRVTVEHRVAEGDAAWEILHLAQAIQCDLIVMGTHGRTGLNRLLTGSVAEEVLRNATCPVMTIKNAPAETSVLPLPAKPLAKPGSIIDIRPLGAALTSTPPGKLIRTHDLDVTRLILPAGKDIFEYTTPGTRVVLCLEGKLAVTALGKTQTLEAGQLLFLPKEEPHTLKGVEDAAVLLTTALPSA
jgi:nucleotide-binding universal stress UspA family protein/quercetin dioxygenase-like cupin family protein